VGSISLIGGLAQDHEGELAAACQQQGRLGGGPGLQAGARASPRMMAAFSAIRPAAAPSTSAGRATTSGRSSPMPIDRKKSPSSRPLNG
jgi:hypothetical protein